MRITERVIPQYESMVKRAGGVVYLMAGLEAKFFAGKALNPTHYYAFKSEERREAYIEEFFKDLAERAESKAERKAAAKAIKEKAANEMKVGDIYCSSWGYDQTNVDFYKIVEVKKSSAVIVRVGSKTVLDNGSYTEVVPAPEHEIGEPMLKRMGQYGFSMSSFDTACKWNGKPTYKTGWGYGH
tara:strand:+ start:769 stop:1320 length:552 start_codon:yes stop_codon:yes gene_type:complete